MTLPETLDAFLEYNFRDPRRFNILADYCVGALAYQGLPDTERITEETDLQGIARNEHWHLTYNLLKKPRLLVALDSLSQTSNDAEDEPDKLIRRMGRAVGVQHSSPAIVIGYVVIVDTSQSAQNDFESGLYNIAKRRVGVWNSGLIEAAWVIRIDSTLPVGNRILNLPKTLAEGDVFFKRLSEELKAREPATA